MPTKTTLSDGPDPPRWRRRRRDADFGGDRNSEPARGAYPSDPVRRRRLRATSASFLAGPPDPLGSLEEFRYARCGASAASRSDRPFSKEPLPSFGEMSTAAYADYEALVEPHRRELQAH